MSTRKSKQPRKPTHLRPTQPAAVAEMEPEEGAAEEAIISGVPVRFVVQRPFKYGELNYAPGDDFIPDGGKFDALLLKHHCKQVRFVNGQEVIR